MNRRGFLIGLSSVVAAPSIVRLESLMPIVSPLVQADDALVGEKLGLETAIQEKIQLDGQEIEIGIQKI